MLSIHYQLLSSLIFFTHYLLSVVINACYHEHMSPVVFIALIVAAPVVVLTALRVNAAIVFLSLCLGSVLVQFVGKDAALFTGLFSSAHSTGSSYAVPIGLLLLPAIFTILVMFHSVKGTVKLILNVLPAFAAGVIGLLLAEPLFSPGLRGTFAQTVLWHHIESLQAGVVIASTIVSLLFLWFLRPRHAPEEGKKHHR